MKLEQFEKAAAIIKTFEGTIDNNTLLELYGLYKRVTVGLNNTTQPWAVQLEARAKWDAWKSKDNLTKDEAMDKYINLVYSILGGPWDGLSSPPTD